jgi:hypothetical protein
VRTVDVGPNRGSISRESSDRQRPSARRCRRHAQASCERPGWLSRR